MREIRTSGLKRGAGHQARPYSTSPHLESRPAMTDTGAHEDIS